LVFCQRKLFWHNYTMKKPKWKSTWVACCMFSCLKITERSKQIMISMKKEKLVKFTLEIVFFSNFKN
jgi:hypothetical protein